MDSDEKSLLEEIKAELEQDNQGSEGVDKETALNAGKVSYGLGAIAGAVDVTKALKELKDATVKGLSDLSTVVKEKKEPPEPKEAVTVKNIRDIPQTKEVRVSNLKDIQIPKPPNEVAIKKPDWYEKEDNSKVEKLLQQLVNKENEELPKDPSDPVAVRLSDGEKFYDAIQTYFGPTGGSNIPKVTATTGGQQAVPITNPDGSNIGAVGFITSSYDYVKLDLTSSIIETYTFKTGGANGTLVATVVVTYTDASKDTIVTVVKS